MSAIAFPRPEPAALEIVEMSFFLKPMEELTPLRSGMQLSGDIGPTLWTARYQSAECKEEDFGELRAWWSTLTSMHAFWGYDRLRTHPRLYRAGWGDLMVGGAPFGGTCTLAAVGAVPSLITLEDLPPGFGLRPGDPLAFDYGASSRRARHHVVAGGDADAGGVLAIEVRPHLRLGWAAGSTVMLHKAASAMKIIPGSWSESVDWRRIGRVSFDAVQTLEGMA